MYCNDNYDDDDDDDDEEEEQEEDNIDMINNTKINIYAYIMYHISYIIIMTITWMLITS